MEQEDEEEIALRKKFPLISKYNLFDSILYWKGIPITLGRKIFAGEDAETRIEEITTKLSLLLVEVKTATNFAEKYNEKNALIEELVPFARGGIKFLIELFYGELLGFDLLEEIEKKFLTVCEAKNIDFKFLKEQLNLDELKKEWEQKKLEAFNAIGKTSLEWNHEKASLDLLVEELILLKWIENKSDFKLLFQKTNSTYTIGWNNNNKNELAHLFYRLNVEEFFFHRNDRGYFNIIADHIKSLTGEHLIAEKTFRNISAKINADKYGYLEIKEEVERIINMIRLKK